MNVPVVADPASALQEHFGFREFRPGQLAVIEHLLAGRSSAAVFPTGGGKSLCYQLPAVLFAGTTVVVSPLIALMKDQIDALAARRIPACRLDSTLSLDEYRDTLRRVRSGELKLLYVAPERFQNERFRELLRQTTVSLLAIDEAHCISEWGHNFRPDYLKLAEFARECSAQRILALTATATPAVLDDIRRGLGIDADCAVRTGFYRPNLTLLTTPVEASDRDHRLLERLRDRAPGPTIIYVTIQKTAELLATKLAAAGYAARPYHAGLADVLRHETQEWFFAEPEPIVVATIAFGMGIDKANIRYVYHYNPPKSLENYAQEIGRAGRDGEPAICEAFFCPDDLRTLENFAYGDTPTAGAVESLVREVFASGESFAASHYDLSSRHDIRMLVVRTLLTYLELDGYLSGGVSFYADYKFKWIRSQRDVLARFEGERRQFLEAIFQRARRAKLWSHLDMDSIVTELRTTRDRVVRALDYLSEQGWIELETDGLRHRYTIVRRPGDSQKLAATLHGRTVERERRELERLAQVVELVAHDGCQVAALGRHFGEELAAACGHCTWCMAKGKSVALPARRPVSISPSLAATVAPLRKRHPELLGDSRAMARFLCGLTSPALTRAKLTGNALFGSLADTPLPEIERALAGG